MYRKAMKDLVQWKKKSNRKPLIIRGARQVGKTWLMKKFGELHYSNTVYINCENNSRIKKLFSSGFDIESLIFGLRIESDSEITENKTLIILDEIQEAPQALTALKYFQENAPQYHIVSAGSLPGVSLHSGISFPVGKVDFLNLHPLNFIEFLTASGNDALVELIERKDFKLISTFKQKYIDWLKKYYFVGGMPEAVVDFLAQNNLSSVRTIQTNLLTAYEQDFSKHPSPFDILKIRMLWNSLPSQLARENRKFLYGLIRSGARAREYESTIEWLKDSGLIHKVFRITKPGIPLTAYQDMKSFKIFMPDVGLLAAHSRLDSKTILEGNSIFEEFKGALTEQYVLQQLMAMNSITPFYWSAEKSTGEIDFIFQIEDTVVPLEVKAAENLQSKSLRNFSRKYIHTRSFRTSLADYRKEDWVTNIPLYAINTLESWYDGVQLVGMT